MDINTLLCQLLRQTTLYSYVEFMKICHIHLLHANKTLVKKKKTKLWKWHCSIFQTFCTFLSYWLSKCNINTQKVNAWPGCYWLKISRACPHCRPQTVPLPARSGYTWRSTLLNEQRAGADISPPALNGDRDSVCSPLAPRHPPQRKTLRWSLPLWYTNHPVSQSTGILLISILIL